MKKTTPSPTLFFTLTFCTVLPTLHAKSFDSRPVSKTETTQRDNSQLDPQTKRWTVAPSFGWTFFNNDRDSWQRETLDVYYLAQKNVLLGGSVDFMQRPPSGDDIRYSFNTSWYPNKALELHGEVAFTPDANFLANEHYSVGLQYTLNPKTTLLFDVERLEFSSNAQRSGFDITQIQPGVTYWFSEHSHFTLRYTHGWLHNEADFDYYSASVSLGNMPHDGTLIIGAAYGTDPDLDLGTMAASLSNAYIGSVYYKLPLRDDLSAYAGLEYVYRMRPDNNGELYQSYTPTIGLTWKF